MKHPLTAFVLAAALASPAAGTAAPLPAPAGDSLLATLVADAFASRPELARAEAVAAAAADRAPQAGALPDPVLSLGLQNDGFRGLRIGEMPTSFWSVAMAQGVPWAGKRGLRARAESIGARQSAADLEREKLGVRADVERAYTDLLLAREQLRILARLEVYWTQAEGLSRSRYASGESPQTDILRAQLERTRLRQRRAALEAGERRALAVLDRVTGRPIGQPIETTASLAALTDPVLPDSTVALAQAEASTPELVRARLGTERSGALLALARREWFPDLTLSGGIMPRGGLEPMWQAGVSLTLPLWGASRQSRGVSEARWRDRSAARDADEVLWLVRQRAEERRATLAAVLEANRLYRNGVLIQSEAGVNSALAQYQVGRVTFATVLDALKGFLDDESGFLESVAEARRLDIAQRELSLAPVPVSTAGAGGAGMPGAGGMGASSAPGGLAPSTPSSAASPAPAMPRM